MTPPVKLKPAGKHLTSASTSMLGLPHVSAKSCYPLAYHSSLSRATALGPTTHLSQELLPSGLPLISAKSYYPLAYHSSMSRTTTLWPTTHLSQELLPSGLPLISAKSYYPMTYHCARYYNTELTIYQLPSSHNTKASTLYTYHHICIPKHLSFNTYHIPQQTYT
jgi:hypothetical protein